MCDHRDLFNPLDNPGDLNYNKPYIELQLLLWVLHRNFKYIPKDCIDYINKLSDHAEKILLNPKYYEQLLVKPEVLRINGAAMMMYLGYKSNEVIIDIIQRGFPIAIKISPELVPFRKMDLEFCIQIVDHILNRKADEKKDITVLADETILNTDIDMINYESNEEYAITHALFYLSDFGEREIPEKFKDRLHHAVQTLAMKNLLVGDMDLLAEYLINMSNLNICNEVYNLSLKELLKNQEDDGSFPGPERCGKDKIDINAKDKKEKRTNIFTVNYHTTLVCIMAILFHLKNTYHD